VRAADLPPRHVVDLAIEHRSPHIAFTYNEPTIWGEYVIDIAREAHASGINTVMVSNGYITREAFFDIYRYIDAANIDLKAFTEKFYSRVTLTHLQPVLNTLRWLRHETGVWFEITNLIIPTLNDDDLEFKQLCDWVLQNLGDDVPLHFTAFHPDFKLQDKPPTPPETLHRARRMAMQMGLKFVYEGNIFSDGGNTICPGCKQTIVKRSWHSVTANKLIGNRCARCGTRIPGVFTQAEAEERRAWSGVLPAPVMA
jgi:pyruvate formate lyase activating enzyme